MFWNKPKAIIPISYEGESQLYEVYDKRNWRGEKYQELRPVDGKENIIQKWEAQ